MARLGRDPTLPVETAYSPSGGTATGQGERDRRVRPVGATASPTTDHRPAEEPPGRGEVARRDGRPDVGAAHRRAVEVERRDDVDLEVALGTELGERRRRAAPLVAERRVRGHEEAGDRRPSLDRADEGVERRVPQPLVEVLDDGDVDPGCGEQPQPLVGIAQERRRGPDEDLVGVVIERDDGRPRRPAPGRPAELAEQVGMAEVEAVEDADDDEQWPVAWPKRVDPRHDRHPTDGGPIRGHRAISHPRSVDEDLVGRQPAVVPRGDRDEAAALVDEAEAILGRRRDRAPAPSVG